MTKSRSFFLIMLIFALQVLLAGCGSNQAMKAAATKDSIALTGVTTGKGFFDINITDANKLQLYLNVIRQTHEGLIAQGVTPDFVIAFRGMSVTLVTAAASPELRAQISNIKMLSNVRLEACSVATGIFGVVNATVLPEIVVVGNTFISSIGYQAKGYAPILIQ